MAEILPWFSTHRGGWGVVFTPLRDEPLPRRELLRRTAAGGVAVSVGALLAACGANKAAAPTTTVPKTVVTFSPYRGTVSKTVQALYDQVLDQFNSQNKTIEVRLTPILQGNYSGTIASILAGNAPDVFEDYDSTPYTEAGYLLDISGYLKGHDMSIFNASTISHFTVGGKIYAMPVSIESMVTAVNLSLLDTAGVALPPQNWTVEQAQSVYETLAKPATTSEPAHYGGAIYFLSGYPVPMYLHGYGATYVDPTNATMCALGATKAIDCGTYLFGLLSTNVCNQLIGSSTADFAAATLGTTLCGSWMIPQFLNVPAGVDWDFYPMPAGPVGSFTYGSAAMYGIPTTTKHAEEAWAFLEWITFEPNLQNALIQMFLLPPATIPLYDNWVSLVKTYAPPLAKKNLGTFQSSVANSVVPAEFTYNSTDAFALVAQGMSEILKSQAAVPEVFTATASQVDTYEQSQAQQASHTSAANN